MKTQWKVLAVMLLVAVSGFLWFRWKQDEPRRNCVKALQGFCQTLITGPVSRGCCEWRESCWGVWWRKLAGEPSGRLFLSGKLAEPRSINTSSGVYTCSCEQRFV